MSPVAPPDIEQRSFSEARVSVSLDQHFEGYAIVFNVRSEDLGGFREIILPEAVTRTLREGLDVRALVDHDSSKVLGRTSAGTLTLSVDRHGLKVNIEPPKTSVARDLVESVRRGDISGMSFSFRTLDDSWRMEDGFPIRDVIDMRIREVSVVTFPAYSATEISARADVALRSLSAFRANAENSEVARLRRCLEAR
jgi:HK97 family phage prohead protease